MGEHGAGAGAEHGAGRNMGEGQASSQLPTGPEPSIGRLDGPVVLTGPAAGRRLASGPIHVRETPGGSPRLTAAHCTHHQRSECTSKQDERGRPTPRSTHLGPRGQGPTATRPVHRPPAGGRPGSPPDTAVSRGEPRWTGPAGIPRPTAAAELAYSRSVRTASDSQGSPAARGR